MNNFPMMLLETLIKDSPYYIFWKDRELVYKGGNDQFLNAIGAESIHEILNKTDYDLPWKATADQYIDTDLKILAGEKIINQREMRYYEGDCQKITLINKLPLKDENGIIVGIVGVHQEMLVLDNNERDIFISEIKDEYNLTRRQKSCLLYLVKGMSYKQIAKTLQLSPKTVEHYLTAIRKKMSCSSRSELIEKALHLSSIQNNLLNRNRSKF